METPSKLRQLTARQAAARLGVKIETIYAYVSRGLLERSPAPDGRSSLFDARSVERLARRRRGAPSSGELAVVLGSGLTLIEDGRLCYRGLDAGALATRAPFEAVAEWLWLGEEPPAPPAGLAAWSPWRAGRDALEAVRHAQRALPDGVGSADRLRVVATVVGPTDPLRFDLTPHGVADSARRLIAALVDGLPSRSARAASALELPGAPPLDDSLATRLWQRLTTLETSPARVALLNTGLVLAADHGLAASTLAARVAASVRADPCSVVATGLGTLSGPLHGAASAPVHRLFEEVAEPERAVAVLGDFLRRERLIPGFGHLIYRDWDPRARVLLDALRAADLDASRLAVVERVLDILLARASVHPNVDFVLGALTWTTGMAESAGETIFGVARSAGWIAHALEEYEEPPLRFRPRAHYVGPAPAPGPK
jgi:citrate synthase